MINNIRFTHLKNRENKILDFKLDYLEPRSNCCYDLLSAKIGSKKQVCNNCNKEFNLISDNIVEELLSLFRIALQKSRELEEDYQYHVGCIGGIKMLLQKSKEEFR